MYFFLSVFTLPPSPTHTQHILDKIFADTKKLLMRIKTREKKAETLTRIPSMQSHLIHINYAPNIKAELENC